ncbi:hypothetical protein BDW22DRAFT_1227445 [Trametopsis cervina]|nr:hypothetical protein BDW22DRAFT_1227445 [Trametopsis cervina]
MQSPLLPFDILSIIFDYLAPSFPAQEYNPNLDRAGYTESEVTFRKCFLPLALVCRHWHIAAYPYLNRILSIRFRQRPGLTPETETETGVVGPKGLLDILQWLDTQPFLPASVRRLRLIMVNEPVESSDKSAESLDKPLSSGCDPSLVHILLRRFHGVRAIELSNLVFDNEQVLAHASTIITGHADVAPMNLNVLVLAYDAQRPLSAHTVQLCTAWFGSVSTFIVRGDSKAGLIGGAVLEGLPARLAARTLTIDAPIHEGVRERLHCSPTFGDQGTLRVLHPRLALHSYDPLGTFMRPAVHVLEELHLDFTPWLPLRLILTEYPLDPAPFSYKRVMNIACSEPVVHLGEMHRLRELTIQLPVLHECFAIVQRIISTLVLRPQTHDDNKYEFPPLRCVTLVLHGVWTILVHQYWFMRVSAVLAGVPTLERCTLDLRASGSREEDKVWFIQFMAELHERGLLHFVV